MIISNEQLRATAKTIIDIPEHFNLVMEDSIPKGDVRERCFIWEDPRNENQIEIVLDLESGQLTRLSIDRDEAHDLYEQEIDKEARGIVDAFVMKHAPNAAEFTFTRVEKRRGKYEFTYCQEVGGLPLPDTGCVLIFDAELNIVLYRFEERRSRMASKPEWPAVIMDAETVKEQMQNKIKMVLTIVCLYPSLFEIEGDEVEYRLVYESTPNHQKIDAVTGLDLFGPEHYVMPPSHPVPQVKSVTKSATDDVTMSWEQQLGLNLEHYTLIKSSDDGERIRSLYQQQEQVPEKSEEDELSVDAYMERKWGDKLRMLSGPSIRIDVEKSTGRLIGYHRMDGEKEGVPILNREQCWKKAEHFLQTVFPDYTEYLQLEVDQAYLDTELITREFFYLPVYINGISVNHERVTISVSAITGDICLYMGVSYEMIRVLTKSCFQALLKPEAAFERYTKHLTPQLKWFLDDERDVTEYRLHYEPRVLFHDKQQNGEKSKKLRYIDAISGEMILERDR